MNGWAPGKHGQEDYDQDLVVQADVCVIGAGAGGCAVAAALAEAGLRVAVLEEGRHWKPSQFRPDTVWAFRNLYQEHGMRTLRGNAVIPLPGGKGVGGSTLVNSAICFRTPPDILDLWRNEYGCDLVTRERFGGYFDRIWKTLGVTVNPVAVQRNNNLIFAKGAEALGLKGSFMERSAPHCVGCGICQYGCPSGGKSSADRTFLAEALAHGTVGVYADCRVRRAETSGDRITAVEGEVLHATGQHPVGTVRVEADTFVLAGGPIGSPLFLLANGLATREHCGAHLVVHPATSLLARFEQEIIPWRGVTQGYYVDCWDRGFLLQTYSLTPDQYYIVFQTPQGRATVEAIADLRHVASAGALIHDQDSEGRVQWLPSGPDLRYHLGDGDRRRLIDGMRQGAEVFFAAGGLEVYPAAAGSRSILPGDDIEAALPYDIPASRLLLYASHPMGTCRMGADPATSVVDPHGRVWGHPNLRVADASVFPTSLGVNPQVTTMAFGLLVGQSIAGVA